MVLPWWIMVENMLLHIPGVSVLEVVVVVVHMFLLMIEPYCSIWRMLMVFMELIIEFATVVTDVAMLPSDVDGKRLVSLAHVVALIWEWSILYWCYYYYHDMNDYYYYACIGWEWCFSSWCCWVYCCYNMFHLALERFSCYVVVEDSSHTT